MRLNPFLSTKHPNDRQHRRRCSYRFGLLQLKAREYEIQTRNRQSSVITFLRQIERAGRNLSGKLVEIRHIHASFSPSMMHDRNGLPGAMQSRGSSAACYAA